MIQLGQCGISYFATPVGSATEARQELHSTDVNRLDPVIRRDERTNHLDKLNKEWERTRLRHRRPPIIRRRDNAAHYDH
jgi:hypothetical protein